MILGDFIEAKLDEVCTKVTDGTHDTPKTYDYGVPFIKAKQIVDGRIDFENCEFISYEDHLKIISRSNPEKGDTLFTHIGASLGVAAFINTDLEFSIKNVALFKPNPENINKHYFFYIVISDKFQNEIKNKRTGAAQPFVNLDILRNHKIRYHINLSIQNKIASILSSYDDLIENNTRRIEILEQMAKLVYEEWFVKFRFPGHENVKIIDDVPEGWAKISLGEVLTLQRGFDLPVKMRKDGTYPIYASTGINGYHDVAKVKGPGVVTGRSGSLGTVLYVPEDFWPLNTTLWVKEFKNVGPIYSVHLLSSLQLEQYNGGVAVPTLNRNDVHRIEVLRPPEPILKLFEKYVTPMCQQIEILKKQRGKLEKTRDLLLPKLISGEIDVSDLDIHIRNEFQES